ncbi:MAG: hypothetical protein K6G28_06555 [Acholeplasmatales bacterium]|nr:hypothetical protein [Acholeplasmatales bacterium]
MSLKFYKLDGNVIFDEKELNLEKVEIKNSDANEKHVPVVEINNNVVDVVVGSNLHPMTEEHYIQYIIVETNKGLHLQQTKSLKEARAKVLLSDNEKALRVYSYCNLHGVYVKEI